MDSTDVLVVEDDLDLRTSIELLLQEEGFGVRTASDGAEALTVAEQTRPQLVLLDLSMPVMDGSTCAQALRSRHGRALRIVMMTAAAPVRDGWRPADADEVLVKPFNISRLIEVVRQYARPTLH